VPASGTRAALSVCLLIGPAPRLDQWGMDISPFTLAVVVGVAGLAGLTRRDIPVT
jgi:hypothetical protein